MLAKQIKDTLLIGIEYGTLNTWQEGFLESVLYQAEKTNALSPAQTKIFEDILESTTPEAIANAAEWKFEYEQDEVKAETFRICVEYYRDSGYFTRIVEKCDSKVLPSEKEYKKLCCNKYSKRVVEAHFATPLFNKGEIVQFRATMSANKFLSAENGAYLKNLANDYAAVIEINALPIRRAAKGAKVYRVLPFGASRAYYVHESDIKKAKGGKK
jgi:hypothetical protein